jgi:hypothetical protein
MKDNPLYPYIARSSRPTPDAPDAHPLVEPSLFYDPPYERPLEDEFAWHLVKYLTPISGLQYQVRVETVAMPTWVDFLVEHGARRVGFEVGEVDEADTQALHYRDALLLGTGAVDVLYRFRGADLMYRIHDALHLAAKWDADLFSARGRINLRTLASPEARAHQPRPHDAVACVAYAPPEPATTPDGEAFAWPGDDVPNELVVRRLARARPGAWIRDYDRALAHFGVSDDALSRQWSRSA